MVRNCLIMMMFVAFSACDDITTSQLPGKWQLKTVEKNGAVTTVDTVWYNFQSESVFLLQFYMRQYDEYVSLYGMKVQEDNDLTIELVSDAFLDLIDWEERIRSFSIESLDSKKLTLRSEEGYLYSFNRF
ncbi:MAG: lipocalin-like domain-containing protein [Tannerella sp.]|nr:lipocalin-like domain-containing protein [Tannerella sp.]